MLDQFVNSESTIVSLEFEQLQAKRNRDEKI